MGQKTVCFQRRNQTEFARLFTPLCDTKNSWEAWADFVTMSALAVANAADQQGEIHDEREREYCNVINRYSKHEQKIFPEMFAKLVEALEEDPEQDFLGEMFMALELGSHWKGQFFTPYSVCRLTAAMMTQERELSIQEYGWVNVSDPCCGAGAFLIAVRNEMTKKGFGRRQALFIAQDIDRTAALMCYLQLSLLGCAGYVIVGDTLAKSSISATGSPLSIVQRPNRKVWITPALYDEVWAYRIRFEKLKQLAPPRENNE